MNLIARTAILSAAIAIALPLFLLGALPAEAQGLQIIPTQCIDDGSPTFVKNSLNCLIETFVTVGRVFFGLSGTFALLMFVIGGFMYLTSAGSEDKVKKGKEYIRNASIGLVIILTAAYGIEYGVNVLRAGSSGTACQGTIYTGPGGEPSCCEGGVVITVQDGAAAGTQRCVRGQSESTCAQLGENYSCSDITNRADQGANCTRGLCPGEDNIRCCPSEL